MVAPTTLERSTVLKRDDFMCVSCGRRVSLEMHHRIRVGAGGSEIRVGYEELLTACSWCNNGFEAELQTEALVYGWKVKPWASPLLVPVYNRGHSLWGFLMPTGALGITDSRTAVECMRQAYGHEWDRWRESMLAEPVGLSGVRHG